MDHEKDLDFIPHNTGIICYKDSRIVRSAQAEIITANNPNLLLLGRNMNNEYLWQLTVYYYLDHK